MTRQAILQRGVAVTFALLLTALTATEASAEPRPPVLKNGQEVLAALLSGNAGALVRHGLTASATLVLEVDETGRVVASRLERKTGNAVLDAALVQAANRMSFEPAVEAGQQAAARVTIPFVFGDGRIDAPALAARLAGKDTK
jgi:TonB family protein